MSRGPSTRNGPGGRHRPGPFQFSPPAFSAREADRSHVGGEPTAIMTAELEDRRYGKRIRETAWRQEERHEVHNRSSFVDDRKVHRGQQDDRDSCAWKKGCLRIILFSMLQMAASGTLFQQSGEARTEPYLALPGESIFALEHRPSFVARPRLHESRSCVESDASRTDQTEQGFNVSTPHVPSTALSPTHVTRRGSSFSARDVPPCRARRISGEDPGQGVLVRLASSLV